MIKIFKRKVNKLIILLMVMSLLIPLTNSFAKEENIYTKMNNDGTIKSVVVVNSFNLKDGNLKDYGEYTNIQNLTNLDKIYLNKDEITIKTGVGNFYYQGLLSKSETPWIIDINYRLDGKKMKRSDILGKSGNFEMEINIRKNPLIDNFFNDSYMLQVSIYLNPEKFSKIESDDATIANAGSNKLVTFVKMPKKDKIFKLKANVKNAEFGETQIVGMPFSMKIEKPKISTFTKDLTKLEEAIKEVNKGTTSLSSGLGELYSGSSNLLNGANLIKLNISNFGNGVNDISSGISSFHEGLVSYVAGMSNFTTGISQFNEGIPKLSKGIGDTNAGLKKFNSGLKQYTGGVKDYTDGVIKVNGGVIDLVKGLEQLSTGVSNLTKSGSDLVNASKKIESGLSNINSQISKIGDLQINITRLKQAVKDLKDGNDSLKIGIKNIQIDIGENISLGLNSTAQNLQALIDKLNYDTTTSGATKTAREKDLEGIIDEVRGSTGSGNPTGLFAIKANIEAFAGSITALDAAIQQLKSGLQEINDNTGVILNGLDELVIKLDSSFNSDNINQLINGIKELSEGQSNFVKGLEEFNNGLTIIDNNLKTNIINGALNLKGGIDLINNNSKKIVDSGLEIQKGADELVSGFDRINQAVNDISSKTKEVKVAIEKIDSGSTKLISNHKKIDEATKKLYKGSSNFTSGISEYAYGISKFRDAIYKIYDGSKPLASGTNELQRETKGMEYRAEKQIEEAMKDYIFELGKQKSFTSEKNKSVNSVQFLYMIDSEKIIKEKVIDKENENKGFIQKLKELF